MLCAPRCMELKTDISHVMELMITILHFVEKQNTLYLHKVI